MQNYFFNLSGTTVKENIQIFRRRPNSMKKLFGQLLELDTRCIDCNSMVKTDDGLQCGLTIFSFDPERQSRSNILLKIYQSALSQLPLPNNKTLFTDRVIELWKLNDLLFDAKNAATIANYNWDIQLTNIVAFFETQSKEKHVKYFELDWKNIVASKFYQSNPNNFSTTKIGIYQAICVDTSSNPNALQIQHISTGD